MKLLFLFLSLTIQQSCLIFLQSQSKSFVSLPNSTANIYTFEASKDNQMLYYATDNKITVYSIIDNKELKTIDIKLNSPTTSICVESDCNQIFLGTKSGKVLCFSLDTGELLFEKDFNSGTINTLALTNDNRFLLCGCNNGLVHKQSVEDRNNASVFHQATQAITSIEISEAQQLIAISSGDGSISLFCEQTSERIENLFIKKEWIRKVAFHDNKKLLLCVGDNGIVYEWNITNANKAWLMAETSVSNNWLISLDINHDGKMECWGGLDHKLCVRTPFGSYNQKLKGPLLKARFIETGSAEAVVACCVLGQGLQIIQVKEMRFKSFY